MIYHIWWSESDRLHLLYILWKTTALVELLCSRTLNGICFGELVDLKQALSFSYIYGSYFVLVVVTNLNEHIVRVNALRQNRLKIKKTISWLQAWSKRKWKMTNLVKKMLINFVFRINLNEVLWPVTSIQLNGS